jgi:DNA-directed RNA polymerase subunit RPC12/RpoP
METAPALSQTEQGLGSSRMGDVISLELKLREADCRNDISEGFVCVRCGRPDTDTGRDDELYCEECYLIVFDLVETD